MTAVLVLMIVGAMVLTAAVARIVWEEATYR